MKNFKCWSQYIKKKNFTNYLLQNIIFNLLTFVLQEKTQSNSKKSSRKSVKSQAVDEVLEILIRNGGMLFFTNDKSI